MSLAATGAATVDTAERPPAGSSRAWGAIDAANRPPARLTPPPWERRAGQFLLQASARVRLVGQATPENLQEELVSLHSDFARGQPRNPRFRYLPPMAEDDLLRRLERAADTLAARGRLGRTYARRADELALEQRLCQTVGQPSFEPLARRRFAAQDQHDQAADRLCARWLRRGPAAAARGPQIRSDDPSDPRSLLSRMRAELWAHRLEVRVVPTERLAALAATGPGVIYVAAERQLALADVERTVLHEVEGHALPRWRARTARLSIFACGTARGSDEQEGRALVLEQEAGWLDGRRKQELALRHLAAGTVQQGASFVETMDRLGRHPAELDHRLRIAARVHRGGGLGRERVYLPAYLRVQAAWQHQPEIDQVLAAGRVAVREAAALHPWVVPEPAALDGLPRAATEGTADSSTADHRPVHG